MFRFLGRKVEIFFFEKYTIRLNFIIKYYFKLYVELCIYAFPYFNLL
jgi:hypothetical protein